MILVPYSGGAATPSEIALAADDRGYQVVFIIHPDDEEARAQTRLLEAWGSVVVARAADDVEAARPVGAVAAVVAFADSVLPIAAEIATRLGLVGNDPAIVPRLVDKATQRHRLNECGIGAVASIGVAGATPLESLRGHVPLPGVLKPTTGAGSRDTIFVDDFDELAGELAQYPPTARFVVEARIPEGDHPLGSWLSDHVSVESAVVAGEVTHLGLSGRLPVIKPARERALLFPIGVDERLTATLYSLAQQAISGLGITAGLVHTEIKLSSLGPTIIEVNARLGGGLATIMPAVGGLDPVGLALDIALNRAEFPALLPDEFRAPAPVGMHYYAQPPFEAVRLETAPETRVLRKLAGVFGADRHVRDGEAVSWRNGSAGRIFDIYIRADSLAELEHRTNAVEAVLTESTKWSAS